MLERIQRPASECLFIDDSLANIRQAEELGYQVIHFQTPERLEDSLRDLNIL
jgi:FMN phosphatase YigB (HAD superfamily)